VAELATFNEATSFIEDSTHACTDPGDQDEMPLTESMQRFEGGQVMENDVIFQPLRFRNMTVKNRLFRSNIAGRFDNYDGSGTQARINWEEKFARGGVGAILSSFCPVHIRGRIVPNYAMIDDDDKILLAQVGEAVHRHDCKYILQLSHRPPADIPGVENFMEKALSSTDQKDTFHGLLCEAMTVDQIKGVVQLFANAARRARDAGLMA
jgi:2,4-dienoyl-CoA reductase (NADPH2)